jgi:hypothetical protein
MSDAAEEIAKAVQSVAKFGDNALETSQKAGSFFTRVFKEPIDEVSMMITDKLRFVRWRRLVIMTDEVNEILRERGVREIRSVLPKLALPIFEESSLEDDPILQQLWNHLLANAMDPSFNGELRYGFVDMIKNITGIEVKILNLIYSKLGKMRIGHPPPMMTNLKDLGFSKENIMADIGIDNDTCLVTKVSEFKKAHK